MRMDSWILRKKNQQDWVTDWMDVVAREGEVKDPSSDRNEESNAEFKSSGTKLYWNIKDNMLIASKF